VIGEGGAFFDCFSSTLSCRLSPSSLDPPDLLPVLRGGVGVRSGADACTGCEAGPRPRLCRMLRGFQLSTSGSRGT
jgi:hypothetical protein